MKVSVFIATSLDGFIARKDGGLDWLDKANAMVPAGEDCGYGEFMASVDVLVMGRNTYEKVLSFGAWPYEKPVVVLSSGPVEIAPDLAGRVSSSSEAPQELYRRLQAEGIKRVYLDGGVTIQRFLAAGLVDELTVTVIPVLLGEGLPLFGALEQELPLRLVESRGYDFGFLQVRYEVGA